MKKIFWLTLLPVLLLGLLPGCGDDIGPEEANGGPHVVAGSDEDPGDGYEQDNSDPDAPKTVESKQIISIDCWFSTMDAAEPGVMGNHIYQLQAALQDGAVQGSCTVRDTGQEQSFRESHSFLNQVYELVDRYDIAQLNGHSIEVKGLPGDYGVDLQIWFASGESITVCDNQDCVLPDGFMDELLALFEGTAKPEPLALRVEPQHESAAAGDGYATARVPLYQLEPDCADAFPALAAALAALNEMRLDGIAGEMDYFRSAGGNLYYLMDSFPTRCDNVLVCFYERTERLESSGWDRAVTDIQTHNIETTSGRELGFSDVFLDMDGLPALIAGEIRRTYPEQSFDSDMEAIIRRSVESDDGGVCYALSYGCVHIFAGELVLNDSPGGQHITLRYADESDLVRALYSSAPARSLLPLEYDTSYALGADASPGFSMSWRPAPESEEVLWTARAGNAVREERFYGYAPDCWLVRRGGQSFLYLRVPTGDVSMQTNVYEIRDNGIFLAGSLPMALRSDSGMDPERMRMSLDEWIWSEAGYMAPYGTFCVGRDGLPEPASEVYGLEGSAFTLRSACRVNAAEREQAAVSGGMWNLAEGTRLTPLETDMDSYIDFVTEEGQVCRFGIDKFSSEMQLDNFGTLDELFAPAWP